MSSLLALPLLACSPFFFSLSFVPGSMPALVLPYGPFPNHIPAVPNSVAGIKLFK